MAVIYDKTYRPVHLNVDAELLAELDEYRTGLMPRSKHIHAALEMYLAHLKKHGRRTVWVFGGGKS